MASINEQVTEKMEVFEREQEPGLLWEAFEIVQEAGRDIPAKEAPARAKQLSRWLHFLALLDRHIDPEWDPDDVPDTKATPPVTSDGEAYSAGVDPSEIDDPEARAEYEEDLQSVKSYAAWYRVQNELRTMDERVMGAIERLLPATDGESSNSRETFLDVVDSASVDESRKEALRDLVDQPE